MYEWLCLTVKKSNIRRTLTQAARALLHDSDAVDLTQEGSWVNWNQNQFDFSGDWTLGVWGRDLPLMRT